MSKPAERSEAEQMLYVVLEALESSPPAWKQNQNQAQSLKTTATQNMKHLPLLPNW